MALWSRYYYYFYFTNEKTEAQREPKNIQLVKQQSPYQLQVSQLWVN